MIIISIIFIVNFVIMLRNYSSYSKIIVQNLKKKDPELYKHLTKSDVDKILRYVWKNVNSSIIKKYDIYFTNFFSLHINKRKLIEKKIRELPEI